MTIPPEEFKRLHELGQDDGAIVGVLVGMFNEQSPDLINDIETQRQTENAEAVKKAAHTLKGVCYNLGFKILGDICKLIEDAGLAGNFDEIDSLLVQLKSGHSELSAQLPEVVTKYS